MFTITHTRAMVAFLTENEKLKIVLELKFKGITQWQTCDLAHEPAHDLTLAVEP